MDDYAATPYHQTPASLISQADRKKERGKLLNSVAWRIAAAVIGVQLTLFIPVMVAAWDTVVAVMEGTHPQAGLLMLGAIVVAFLAEGLAAYGLVSRRLPGVTLGQMYMALLIGMIVMLIVAIPLGSIGASSVSVMAAIGAAYIAAWWLLRKHDVAEAAS